MTDTFNQSLWSALSGPLIDLPELTGTATADVVVVGSGILGLSLTLHLAEQGADVVLVDAHEPGFGASGRNTGFVVPSFPGSVAPSDLVAPLGADRAETLARFVGGSGNDLFDLVKRLSLSCSAEQNGWLQPAHTPAKVAVVEGRVRQWQKLGQPVRLLDAAETRRVTGSDRYVRALLDPTGGQINPLAYARELARAAVAAGARIFVRSPAEKLAREASGWRVSLAGGSVLADQVFCTTNALVGDLLPDVRRSIIRAQPYQVATQPLGDALRRRILPDNQPVADLHRHVFAYRWSPDGRLVSGGIAVFNDRRAVARMAGYFLRRLRYYLPDLPPLRADFAWRGVVAATDHRIPQIWRVAPGLYAPVGCNGRGVAVTTALGGKLADYARTGQESDLPVGIGPPRPKALHGLLDHGPSAWLAWSRSRDWIDDRFKRA